jgi:hypothetical protein
MKILKINLEKNKFSNTGMESLAEGLSLVLKRLQ